jgi:hypothetical protein
MSTSLSLRASRVMKLKQFLPHDYTWYFALSLVSITSSLIGIIINLWPWHRVPWLYNKFTMDKVEDKGDVWAKAGKDEETEQMMASPLPPVPPSAPPHEPEESFEMFVLKDNNHSRGKSNNRASEKNYSQRDNRYQLETKKLIPMQSYSSDVDTPPPPPKKKRKRDTFKTVIFVLSKLVFFLSYLIAFAAHSYAVSASLLQTEDVLQFGMILSSYISCSLITLGAILFFAFDAAVKCNIPKRVPFLAKLIAPFCLSSSIRALIESDTSAGDGFSDTAKIVASYCWIYLMAFMFLFALLESCLVDIFPVFTCCNSFGEFFVKNFRESGVNKKTVRFFDTLGSVSALTALILGLCSLFIDQYDITFEPEGIIEDAVIAGKDFYNAVKPVTLTLSSLISAIDKQFGCDEVYAALTTGAAVTLFSSFFPGASSVASISARGAYYGVRAANAFTNLARRLRKSKNTIWQVAKAVLFIQKFALGSTKLVLKTSNAAMLAKLLPFLPPVVIGIYVLFAAFWPQRILFFSAKQRRKTMDDQFYSWLLTLFLLALAITINTWLVDEVVRLLDENIPVARVGLDRKLGWYLNMAASAFCLLSGLSFTIRAFILKWQTWRNHENITNAELDWKFEVEKRELITIRTAIGDKLEKRTQLKYKKERIGAWTWVLPILLCTIACGFGFLANVNPKLEFSLEPKGRMGRLIDNILDKIDFYDADREDVTNDTMNECLTYTSFSDVIGESGYSNILMKPVDKFFNETEKIVKPLKDSLRGLRKQLALDFQEDLFGDSLNNIWTDNNLQYIGMLFTVPRILCLFILIFGMFMASINVCMMRIFDAVEPRRLISAYGKIGLFSIIYVIGSQLAIFNLLSAVGVPFYHLKIRFGLGFIYDVVADFILISVYIGMKNEFFFAVPKRRTVVVYEVPGVSNMGPNIPGTIV